MEKEYTFKLTEWEAQDIITLLVFDEMKDNKKVVDKILHQLLEQGGSYAAAALREP